MTERNLPPWLRTALALVVIALAYFYRLDQPLLWGDEADTGIEARQVAIHGYPLAFDGRNISCIDDGAQLNRDLVCVKVPWAQYYLGALSLLLFGNDTGGLRVLFALCGLLAFFPIHAVLKTRLRFPTLITTLILLAPQVVLFQRNARYYPLLILVYALLAWHFTRKFESRRTHFLLAALIFTCFFHIHSFAAMSAVISVLVVCLLVRREASVSYASAAVVGFLTWTLWAHILGPPITPTEMALNLLPDHIGPWLTQFVTSVWATLLDADSTGAFPLLLWAGLTAFFCLRGSDLARHLFREPLVALIVVNVIMQGLTAAALFGTEAVPQHSMLRYQPHLVLFEFLLTLLALNAVFKTNTLYLLAVFLSIGFNFFTLSYWANPLAREIPVSWITPTYRDIIRPPALPWDKVIAFLRDESQKSPHHDSVIISLPAWTQDVTIFYLGDRYFIRPLVYDPSGAAAEAISRNLRPEAFHRINAQTEWIIAFLNNFPSAPPGYAAAFTTQSYVFRPDDGTRPELTWHRFEKNATVRNVIVYHLIKPAVDGSDE